MTKVDDFMGSVQRDLAKRFTKAGVYFTSKTRGYLNVAQPYKRAASGRYHGLAPSSPGEFPRKLSGELQRSITWNLDKQKMVLTVGTNLKGYPGFLQTGTKWLRPRPWLSLSFDKEKATLGKILTK